MNESYILDIHLSSLTVNSWMGRGWGGGGEPFSSVKNISFVGMSILVISFPDFSRRFTPDILRIEFLIHNFFISR